MLVLGRTGYRTAVEGESGFVCFVERSLSAGLDDAVFWAPEIRTPNCFNAPTVRSGLPQYRKRTKSGQLRGQHRSYAQEAIVLELRPNCECCDRDLPPDSVDARICTFECTFCSDCATVRLGNVCPNCGGELVPRPRRPSDLLSGYPASAERIVKPNGCDS